MPTNNAWNSQNPAQVAKGGTGATTLTGVLIGNGTSPVTGNAISQFDVLVGGSSNAISSIGPGSAGQVLQSAGNASNPAYSSATFPVSTVANQILYSSATNTVAGLTTANDGVLITSNTGVPSFLPNGTVNYVLTANTAAPPSWQPTASSSISITGDTGGALTGNSFTFTGGTTGLSFGGSGTTETVSGTLVVPNGGTGASSFNTTGVVISGATSTTALASVTLTDGQLAIGSSSGNPAAANLSAGSGINITNGSHSITISSSGGGFTWSDNSGSFTAVKSTGYFITAASTPTLPASPSQGDIISFVIDNASTCTITANTGQKIRLGSALSASAGTCANNSRGDAITLVYRSTGTTWFAISSEGTWSIT
jgi:hypothetical protein